LIPPSSAITPSEFPGALAPTRERNMPLDARYEGDVRSGSPGGKVGGSGYGCGGRAVVVGSRDGGWRIQLLFRRYLSS